MFDSVTAHTLYSEIVMQRDHTPRAFLLVEGPEDSKTLYAHISEEKCQILICEGRENVLGAMVLVCDNLVSGVGALVDADHSRRSVESRISLPGVVVTDLNDLDSEVLHIPGLVERVGYSHVDSRYLYTLLTTSDSGDIRAVMHKIVAPITALRYMCERYGVPISTTDFPVVAIYKKGEFALDSQKVKVIAKHKLQDDLREKYEPLIEAWVSAAPINEEDLKALHNGHQLFHALHALLRCECGYEPKVENLENSVRAAVAWADLWNIPCIRRLSEHFESLGYWIWRYSRDSSPSAA